MNLDYYRELLEDIEGGESEEELDKSIFAGNLIEAVENQLANHDPAFVTEVFLSLQQKGYNRKQARTVIASVLTEEMYYILKDGREYDEKKYEAALRKQNRKILTNIMSVPDVMLAEEMSINAACEEIWDALSDNDEETAVEIFLTIWPEMKEYVIHNLYRDTPVGIEKPDISAVSGETEYKMNFDSLLPEMGIYLCNVKKYEETINFSEEVLELFDWRDSEPDTYKNDIGQALADMGRASESDAWYRQWLEEEPDNGNCVNGYAFCHQIRGDVEGALAIVEAHLPDVEKEDYKYGNLYERAADLYKLTGDTQKAAYYRELAQKAFRNSESNFFMMPDEDLPHQPLVKEKKVYPNDPCPCGSGKKYKKCCGRN